MHLIEVSKLYGLGKFEQSLVGKYNNAIQCILGQLPDDVQIEIFDRCIEGEVSSELH